MTVSVEHEEKKSSSIAKLSLKLGYIMFLTTPLVRYVTARLHEKGALDADHKASLHRYDLFINLAVTAVGAIAALVYFLG